jgi:hypothetical protein
VYSNTGSFTFSGFNYANTDNTNYLNPIPTEAGTGSNVAFAKTSNENKFTIPMQGGTDGTTYAQIKKIGAAISTDGTNVFGFDLSSAATAGAGAYNKALNILANPEEHSFDLLVLPGVIEQYHSAVTALAEIMVEERTDCVYIRDLAGVNESVASAIAQAAGLDSSYSATYFPWVRVKDIGSNRDIFVPPSVIVPQAYAYNDRVAEEWFAQSVFSHECDTATESIAKAVGMTADELSNALREQETFAALGKENKQSLQDQYELYKRINDVAGLTRLQEEIRSKENWIYC